MIKSTNKDATKKWAINWSLTGSSMFIACLFGVLEVALSLGLLVPEPALAHGIAGNRFFPTTFAVDDPFISDEFSILVNRSKQSGNPSVQSTEINIDASKRIVPDFGFEFHEAYLHQKFEGDGTAHGWENAGIGAKWQFLTNAPHELIMSIGTDVEIGGTGAHQISDSFSHITPGIFFGKGLGDISDSVNFIRPFAITGAIGVGFPTRSKNVTTDPDTGNTNISYNAKTFNWGFTIQYSLMYLQQHVKDIGLPAPFNRMILVVEFPMQTNLSQDSKGLTTGTINPGVVWAGKFMEFGLAAQVPVNSQSGKTVGVLGLIHFFIDDLFPKSIGRPIFY